MTTSFYHDAMAHHIWATERLIDACAELSPEQLRTPAHGTYGPIIDTLKHLVGSDRWYLTFFREGLEEIDEAADVTLAELRAAITESGTAWVEVIGTDLDADADVVEHGDGWDFHAPVGLRLAQVVHHGTDHRSQVCTALTSLGIEPPEIDVWDYGRAVGLTRGEDLRPA